jgi:hypothetical protein
MKVTRKTGPLWRATGVIGIVLTLVSGVTFAALQSQNVKLTGNTIQSATAGLTIGTAPGSLGASSLGFSFANVEPGGVATPATGNTFYLQNTGSTSLTLHMSVDQFTNTSNVNLAKVYIILTPITSGGAAQTIPLATLIDSYNTGGFNLAITQSTGSLAQYKLQAKMDADAITGGPSSGATITDIQFVFSGVTASV